MEISGRVTDTGELQTIVYAPQSGAERVGDARQSATRSRAELVHDERFARTGRGLADDIEARVLPACQVDSVRVVQIIVKFVSMSRTAVVLRIVLKCDVLQLLVELAQPAGLEERC